MGTFEDQSKGKAVSDEFYNAGADIVMPVAGPVGAGTLASAKEADDRMVIWVDADGFETNSSDEDAQAVILTSVMKEMSTAVEDVISGLDGQFDGTPYVAPSRTAAGLARSTIRRRCPCRAHRGAGEPEAGDHRRLRGRRVRSGPRGGLSR